MFLENDFKYQYFLNNWLAKCSFYIFKFLIIYHSNFFNALYFMQFIHVKKIKWEKAQKSFKTKLQQCVHLNGFNPECEWLWKSIQNACEMYCFPSKSRCLWRRVLFLDRLEVKASIVGNIWKAFNKRSSRFQTHFQRIKQWETIILCYTGIIRFICIQLNELKVKTSNFFKYTENKFDCKIDGIHEKSGSWDKD